MPALNEEITTDKDFVRTASMHQGTVLFMSVEEILPSHQPPTDGSMMSLDFNFDNFPDIPGGPILEADAPIGEKLILPENFQENTVLNQLRTHHFRTAGQLRDKINNNPPVWLSKFEAYAILANPHVFCAHDIDDFVDRNNGTVVLVKSIEYANFLSQGRGYKLESPMTISIEKYSGQFKISGEVTLDRHEIVGDLWTRRRIQLTGDNNFSLIQWITTSRKKKDSVKSDVSNLVKVVGEMRTQLSFVATDVTNINARVTEIHNNMQQRDDINSSLSSAVTQLSASVVALLGRVPQEQPTDPNTSG